MAGGGSMAAGGAQPFQCVNKYVNVSELGRNRLILCGGQQKTAADAVYVMGTPSWKAGCECGCNKSYDINYAVAYPPKIEGLREFYTKHDVAAGNRVTITCDPAGPSITLAVTKELAAGGGGAPQPLPSPLLPQAPPPAVPQQPQPPAAVQQQLQRTRQQQLAAGTGGSASAAAAAVAPCGSAPRLALLPLPRIPVPLLPPLAAGKEAAAAAAAAALRRQQQQQQQHKRPAPASPEVVGISSDEEQQAEQQEQQQRGPAASAAAGSHPVKTLPVAGNHHKSLSQDPRAIRRRQQWAADVAADVAAGRAPRLLIEAQQSRARQKAQREGPDFDVAAFQQQQQQRTEAAAAAQAARAADNASGAAHEAELLEALRTAAALVSQQQRLPLERIRQLLGLLRGKVPADRIWADSPAAAEMRSHLRTLIIGTMPRPLSPEELEQLQLPDRLLPAVRALLGRSRAQALVRSGIGPGRAVQLVGLPAAAYEGNQAAHCQFAVVGGQLKLSEPGGGHVHAPLPAVGSQDLRHSLHLLRLLEVPEDQAQLQHLREVLQLYLTGVHLQPAAAAGRVEAAGGGGGGGGGGGFVLWVYSNKSECPTACVYWMDTTVFLTVRNSRMRACAVRARRGQPPACQCWQLLPGNMMLPLPPQGQDYPRCSPILLLQNEQQLCRELDAWAAQGGLPGVTSVLLPSGAVHQLMVQQQQQQQLPVQRQQQLPVQRQQQQEEEDVVDLTGE